MKAEYLAAMDVGPRANQQDCILAGGLVRQAIQFYEREDLAGGAHVFAVCDGLGGHTAGDQASRLACENMASLMDPPPATVQSVKDAIQAVQERLVDSGIDWDAGTTLAGLAAVEGRVFVFNVGDSRVYRVRKEGVRCVSHDHSFVQRLVDEKFLSDEEAFTNPFKNLVDFGVGPVFTDRWEQGGEAFVFEEPLVDGAVYLVCSDGLNDVLTDPDIRKALGEDPLENGDTLMRAVDRAGMKDNTSFILVRFSLP